MQFKPLPEWWNLYWWSEQFHLQLRAWLYWNTLPKQWVLKYFDRMYAIYNFTSEMPGDIEFFYDVICSKYESYFVKLVSITIWNRSDYTKQQVEITHP